MVEVASAGEGALMTPPISRVSIVPIDDVREDTPEEILSPKAHGRSGMVVTANDLQTSTNQDAHADHERSQDILQQVMQRRGVNVEVRAPYVASSMENGAIVVPGADASDDARRMEFTHRIFNRLKERGIHGIRTLRVMLHNMDVEGKGQLPSRTFEGALTHMGIRLRPQEHEILLKLFGTSHPIDRHISYVQFLAHGVGNWATARLEAVQEAYDYLCGKSVAGILTVDVIEKQFNTLSLTTDLCPLLVAHSALEEFLKQWSDSVLSADGVITWVDFLDYYLDVSWCFSSHHDFCSYVCKSWSIDMDDWLAKKVFRRYATDNEDTLPVDDFLRMLHELDPGITEEEARAWYIALDEDGSGEVDLQEFLSSKVLTVKRLFDKFDPECRRVVDMEQMICILESFNASISREDAIAVYHCADLDGNGDVSFTEFLENNLLKLLQIFDMFDRDRGGDINEAEIKQLLRNQDPYLDDNEIHRVYKAIDTDGGGSISFAEFCESQVIRAKSLFDRYDIDGSRALTQFKFQELMFDMDSTLTTAEMEAIYNLVVDHTSGKVTLGGFLKPNIVKLKMLFDKYDRDRSRHLDVDEFKLMLKELFKSASEKEIDDLQRFACDAELGINFTQYIHCFKELSRKHDTMQLAKKRLAREKAKSKGLFFVA